MLIVPMVHSAVLKVGPGRALQFPSQAADIAQVGDVIEIDAGIYSQDVAIWRTDKLTIRGVNGLARLMAGGAAAEGKGIWVIKGSGVVVENIEFAHSRVPSKNGAGIRVESRDLTIRNCVFRQNENGILAGDNRDGVLIVEDSLFDGNGHGDGYTHNIYIGAYRKFILNGSTIRGARVGHQVKSRAESTIITNNLIEDGAHGNSSYLIDLPAGGRALIENNRLHQGLYAVNSTMVAYGAEKLLHQVNHFVLRANVFVNDYRNGCRSVWIKPVGVKQEIKDNQFIGCDSVVEQEYLVEKSASHSDVIKRENSSVFYFLSMFHRFCNGHTCALRQFHA